MRDGSWGDLFGNILWDFAPAYAISDQFSLFMLREAKTRTDLLSVVLKWI